MISYFERMLSEAKAQEIVPASLDIVITAQALLAYFEGVMLLGKDRDWVFYLILFWSLCLSAIIHKPCLIPPHPLTTLAASVYHSAEISLLF
jgi:hypothetical protein